VGAAGSASGPVWSGWPGAIGAPPAVAGAGGTDAAGPVVTAARSSRVRAKAPAAAPIRTGTASIALESGRVAAATRPISVNTPSPASP
jgi:hypothetical protein